MNILPSDGIRSKASNQSEASGPVRIFAGTVGSSVYPQMAILVVD
ncbi:MAG: hypothetical protein R3E26_03250 [Nitrosomonas sp.]